MLETNIKNKLKKEFVLNNEDVVEIKNEYEYNKLMLFKEENKCPQLTYKWKVTINSKNYYDKIPYGVNYLYLNYNYIKHSLPDTITFIKIGLYNNIKILNDFLPNNLKELYFSIYYKQPLNPGVLPNGLKRLEIYNASKCLSEDTIKYVLPKSLEHLKINDCPAYLVNKALLPPNIRYLELYFRNNDNNKLIEYLPSKLVCLELNNCLDYKIKNGVLPNTLKKLIFGSCYNQILESGLIPEQLEELIIRSDYIYNFEPNVLPKKLKRLIFQDSYGYKQKLVPDILPEYLEELTLSYNYSEILEPGVLPKYLKKITFGSHYYQELIPGVFPTSLRTLILPNCRKEIKPGLLPEGLTHLRYNGLEITENLLPSTLKCLWFINTFNNKIDKKALPNSIEKIIFSDFFNQKLDFIFPDNLIELRLGNYFNQTIEKGDLPEGLKILKIDSTKYNKKIEPNVLPNSITNLRINKYPYPIEKDMIPDSLNYLSFGPDFNQEIKENTLPTHIKTLSLGYTYNKYIKKNVLPPNLRILSLGKSYEHIINYDMPKTLEKLIFLLTIKRPVNTKYLPKDCVITVIQPDNSGSPDIKQLDRELQLT